MGKQVIWKRFTRKNRHYRNIFGIEVTVMDFVKPFCRYFIRGFCLILLPILLSIAVLIQMISMDYKEESRARLQTMIEDVVQDFDAELEGLSNSSSQVSGIRYFTYKYIYNTPTAFFEIRNTLEAIIYSNRFLRDGGISFYSQASPNTFYTEMGTYNEQYYRKYYNDETKELINAKQLLEFVDYCLLVPNYNIVGQQIIRPTLDVIYRIPKIYGSFLMYSISETMLDDALILDAYNPDAVLLFDRNGRKLYPLNLNHNYQDQMMQQAILQQRGDQMSTADDEHELIMIQSPVSGLWLGYWMNKDQLFGDAKQMETLLVYFFMGLAILGCIVLAVFSRGEAIRNNEVRRLVKRFHDVREKHSQEAAFDRIKTLLVDYYSDHEENKKDIEQEFSVQDTVDKHEKKSTNDLLSPVIKKDQFALESVFIESILIRRIIKYINQHQTDNELNVSMLSQVFDIEISNLSHQFKNSTGYILSDYITAKKLSIACQWLRDNNMTINEISERLGYSVASSFIRTFKKVYGVTPAQYRTDQKPDIDESYG